MPIALFHSAPIAPAELSNYPRTGESRSRNETANLGGNTFSSMDPTTNTDKIETFVGAFRADGEHQWSQTFAGLAGR